MTVELQADTPKRELTLSAGTEEGWLLDRSAALDDLTRKILRGQIRVAPPTEAEQRLMDGNR